MDAITGALAHAAIALSTIANSSPSGNSTHKATLVIDVALPGRFSCRDLTAFGRRPTDDLSAALV